MPVVEAVALTSQHANEESLCKLLPYIKDMIRLALKVEQLEVQRHLLETLANLTLVEQCRYEITHLKGIETFAKFLESSEKA